MKEERVTELEIKMAYQEDLLQALNKIVSEQQSQIIRLEKTCGLLNERIKNMAEPSNINQGFELPPHY
ncbi:MAG: SlyX family protein [Methylococcales bacterium]|nr:SlyX family protein [Methylococcales bacterium]